HTPGDGVPVPGAISHAPDRSVRAADVAEAALPKKQVERGRRMISETEFRAFAAQGFNRIPMVLESFADLDTPLSLYLKLANQRYTFLLESVVGGERFGRYSFIGLPAKIRIRSRARAIEVEDRGGIVERHEGDPLEFVG